MSTQLKPISLGFTSNPGRAAAAGSARLLNCYAENAGNEQKAKWQIWACRGLASFSTFAGAGSIRAMLEVDGTLIVVAGVRIYTVSPGGTAIDVGGIATQGPVYMARNRRAVPQVGIVSDGVYVVYSAGSVVQVYDPDLSPPTSIAFSDGYFVFSHENGTFSHTESDNATNINGLAFASAESNADTIVRMMALQSFVLPFGKKSIEWWQDVGGTPFAFQRDHSIQIGCAAAGSCAEVEQTIMWIADDLTVRILQGHSAVKVSTHAVDRAIAKEPNVANIVAVTWREEGHTFYCISGSTFSYSYDLSAKLWHNRESYGLSRWRVSCVAEFNGQLVAGDYASTKLYTMGANNYDEAGTPMIVEIITPPVHAWPERVKIATLYLDMIPGVGL